MGARSLQGIPKKFSFKSPIIGAAFITMILALAATQIEMEPLLRLWPRDATPILSLITGVGPMETALRLTRFFCWNKQKIDAALNFGVGGAYLQPEGKEQPKLLDICLAEQEVAGDLGICLSDRMQYLDRSITGDLVFSLDPDLLAASRAILDAGGVVWHSGIFVTVNAASGTRRRGDMLQGRWQGLCENMEGVAVARVCQEFSVPCIELRAISNYVEDRKPENWQLQEACLQAAQSAALIIKELLK